MTHLLLIAAAALALALAWLLRDLCPLIELLNDDEERI